MSGVSPPIVDGGRRPPRPRVRTRSPYEPHVSDLIFGKLWLRPAGGLGAGLSLDFRIWLLGLGRAQPGGHAPFGQGHLRRALVNEETGELFARQSISAAIKRLASAGLLAPTSGTRCLVYPVSLVDVGFASGSWCPECGTRDSWHARHGWVSSKLFKEYPEWFIRASVPDSLTLSAGQDRYDVTG